MKPLMEEKQELRIKNQTGDATNGAVREHCETEFCLGEGRNLKGGCYGSFYKYGKKYKSVPQGTKEQKAGIFK